MYAKDKKIVCLGIESTAHEFSCGIASSTGEIMANTGRTYVPKEGGIHPREASQFFSTVAGDVLNEAFKESKIKPSDIGVVAFSQGPGLGPCLRTGATMARALSIQLSVPLVGVNHCIAHIEIGKHVTGVKDPVTLYVSGGNTIVTAYESGKYRIFGETLDIAIGNCLDVFARAANLPYPGGPIVEKLAKKGHNLIQLPYIVKGMDLSFSGLLTAAIRTINGDYTIEDICFSVQEYAFSMLTEVTERALAHTEKKEILLTGGVAANKRLQEMLRSISSEHNAQFFTVPAKYAGDNGAMIAWTGLLAYSYGRTVPVEKSYVRQRWRLDATTVPWVKGGAINASH
ncbi:MAG TPA: KEOPS complex N(6)-L-threonylcarbamoyladenine synthase Kae1 [archaeon]|nr:KEOPS complex N(6)-L-threonylcarbamoyladenine synthase Kae1 [archaeon]